MSGPFIVCEDAWPPKESTEPFRKAKKKPREFSSETDMTEAIVDKFNDLDYPIVKCQKIRGTAFGKPTLDIFGVRNSRFFWLEVKQPGETPTKRQVSTMKAWIKKGAIASWTDHMEGAISFICIDWETLTEKEMLEGFSCL